MENGGSPPIFPSFSYHSAVVARLALLLVAVSALGRFLCGPEAVFGSMSLPFLRWGNFPMSWHFDGTFDYPLVNVYITMEHHHAM